MEIREKEFRNHRTSVRVSGVKVDEHQNRESIMNFGQN